MIACISRRTLIKYSNQLGGDKVAAEIYERADQTVAMGLNLLADLGMRNSKTPTHAVPEKSPERVKGIPDWATLFGSLELCELLVPHRFDLFSMIRVMFRPDINVLRSCFANL